MKFSTKPIDMTYPAFIRRALLFSSVFILLGFPAESCPDSPDIIRLSGSTFISERISVERPKKRNRGGGHTVHFGGSALEYRAGHSNCWKMKGKCLQEWLKSGQNHIAIKNGASKIGVLGLGNAAEEFRAYSVNASGQKDPGKPYLIFREEVVYKSPGLTRESSRIKGREALRVDEYKLTINGYDQGRRIGYYESLFRPDGPFARGLPAAGAKTPGGVMDLRGNSITSQSCQAHVKRL